MGGLDWFVNDDFGGQGVEYDVGSSDLALTSQEGQC